MPEYINELFLSAEQAADRLCQALGQVGNDLAGGGGNGGVLHTAGNGVIPAGTLGGFLAQRVVPGAAFGGFLLAGFALRFSTLGSVTTCGCCCTGT